MNVLELARPEIKALAGYSSARMEATGGAIFLNANESAYPPFPGGEGWNRYPDPQPAALVQRLAGLYGVAQDCVLVGRGSDEGIDLLVRAFCAAGRDAIVISPPTFGMYAVCARVQNARVVEVPLLPDMRLDADAVLAACRPEVKLVFVCTPNNPSGGGVARAAVLSLAEALAGRALLVVDEAYVEFAGSPGVADCVGTVENLVVLRTLSKAWALAGVRIGALLADPRVVALLRKIMPPYPLPVPSVTAALQALSPEQQMCTSERIAAVVCERGRMRATLAGLRCVRGVLPSEANFLTVRFGYVAAVLSALSAAGVVVRDLRHYPMLADALRITVGAPEENDAVLAALAQVQCPSAMDAGVSA